MTIPILTPVAHSSVAYPDHYDAVVLVAPSFDDSSIPFHDEIQAVKKVDSAFGTEVTLLTSGKANGGRLIIAPTGSLTDDTDDVRKVADATKKGITRAKSAGSVKPLLIFHGMPGADYPEYSHYLQVALLGVYDALYERLQARESLGEDELEKVKEVGFVVPEKSLSDAKETADVVRGIELGRRLARDLGGADPERMTPIMSAAYIQQAFVHYADCVKVEIVEDDAVLKRDYPLLHAVARASITVPRHRPVVVRLEYNSPNKEAPEETMLIAGKGVTYDSGGADVKTGGSMAGMSRDKCGAAAAAGVVLTAAVLKPSKLRIVTELGFVRNSIGADAFVSDEIITAHSGARVLIANTDAEGRLLLSDCLSHLRDLALKQDVKNPKFFTIATLTGHVGRAYGPYTAAIDNGAARSANISQTLQRMGHVWGEPLEVSTYRREDLAMVATKNNAYDVLQCNLGPSTMTNRGHQFPLAFLLKTSGLSEHGRGSKKPLACTHLDIAGSAVEAMEWQFGKPTATPLVALAAHFILPHLPNAAKLF